MFFQNVKKLGITKKIFIGVLVYLDLENVSEQETSNMAWWRVQGKNWFERKLS